MHGPKNSDVWAMDDLTITTPLICPKFNGVECGGNGKCFQTGQCLCNDMFFGISCEKGDLPPRTPPP